MELTVEQATEKQIEVLRPDCGRYDRSSYGDVSTTCTAKKAVEEYMKTQKIGKALVSLHC